MADRRDLRLDKYGVSKHRYRELKYFCLQYNEWKDLLKYNTNNLKSSNVDGMPRGNGTGDSTQSIATKRTELSSNCKLIEQTMVEAITTLKKGNTSCLLYDGDYQDIYDHMLKAVVNDDITYTYLDQVMNIPIGRASFYKLRRYFFFLLDKAKT